MNTKALRQKVLDLAIHGKLVPQNPTDESAEKLLERIRLEKAERIKKGELKVDKKDSYIFVGTDKRHYEKFADGTIKDIEDEIPFDVPEGWAWCRLGEICTLKGGKRIPVGLSAIKTPTEHIYIRVTDMKNNSISDEDLVYIDDLIFNNIRQYIINKTDLYLTIAGTIGRVGEVPEKFDGMNLTENALKLTNIIINKRYLMFVISSTFVQDYFESTYHQVAMPKLSLSNASKTLIPLSPIAEQQRIVAKVEELFLQIDSLEENKIDLSNLIKQAKSKILDLAIHGKLVPQDPTDEPASVLLEKIRAEKEEKISKGELKRDKNDSSIYKGSDNFYYQKFTHGEAELIEVPFLLPNSWIWCPLGTVCDYGKCITVDTTKLKPEDWILDLEDIEKDTGIIIAYKTYKERKSESTKHKFYKGQVLYSKLRPYLNKVVVAPNDGFCTSEILPLDFNGLLINRYAQIILMSSYFLQVVSTITYGVKMPRLGTNDAKKIIIPIPPLNEQKQIVDFIESTFQELDNILLNIV